jgi:hypothetical protein
MTAKWAEAKASAIPRSRRPEPDRDNEVNLRATNRACGPRVCAPYLRSQRFYAY